MHTNKLVYYLIALIFITSMVSISCQRELQEPQTGIIVPVDTTHTDTTIDDVPDTIIIPQKDTNVYFIRFNANGEEKQFNMVARASFFTVPGSVLYSAYVEGQEGLVASISRITMYVNDSLAIDTAHTYTNQLLGNTYQATLAYFNALGNQYSSPSLQDVANVQIRFTTITDKYVAGTFSGSTQSVLGLGGVAVPLIYEITNGAFKVHR